MTSQGASGHDEEPSNSSEGTVLLVANYAPDVGFAWWLMENFWVQLADVARSRGLSPLIVYPKSGEIPTSIRAAEVETEVLRFPGSGVRGLVKSLKLIRARRVRCIYLTDRDFTRLWYALFRLAGVETILVHDHTPGDRPPARNLKGLLKSIWRRLPLVNSDLQLCVSPLIRERAIANARIPARRTVVVQNGIDAIECSDDRTYAHRVLGIPAGSSLCMMVSRASRYKRVDFMIEVARRCILELGARDLYFVHCGDGPDLSRLRRLAEEACVEERLVLAGRRSDVRHLLCSASYALHPAKGEAFSLAVLEYMSAGLVVLVPDIPTVRQAIRAGETGLVFPDGDAGAAAKLLLDLHEDRAQSTRMGAAASAEVRRHYSLASMNRTFRDVVGGVLPGE